MPSPEQAHIHTSTPSPPPPAPTNADAQELVPIPSVRRPTDLDEFGGRLPSFLKVLLPVLLLYLECQARPQDALEGEGRPQSALLAALGAPRPLPGPQRLFCSSRE